MLKILHSQISPRNFVNGVEAPTSTHPLYWRRLRTTSHLIIYTALCDSRLVLSQTINFHLIKTFQLISVHPKSSRESSSPPHLCLLSPTTTSRPTNQPTCHSARSSPYPHCARFVIEVASQQTQQLQLVWIPFHPLLAGRVQVNFPMTWK